MCLGASTAQAGRGVWGGRPSRRGVAFVRSSRAGTALAPPPGHPRPRAANSEEAAAPVPTPPRRRDAVRIPDPPTRTSQRGGSAGFPLSRDPEPAEARPQICRKG